MDAKRKATLDELIGQPEESEEEKKNPDMLDLEEPKEKWKLKTFIIAVLTLAIMGLAYTAYLSITSTKNVISEEKIENLIEKETAEVTPESAKSVYVYVNADGGLNLRESASATAKVVTTVPNKAKLSVVATEGDWYKVNYEAQTGYVSKKYTVETLPTITPTITATPTPLP
ncbi:MAG: SH3 domain-containing protein [bacterium]